MEKDSPTQPLDYASPVKPPSETKLENLLATFNSPTSRLMVFQIAGMIGLIALAWLIISAFFSLFSVWVILAAMIVLAGFVFYKERQRQQRDWWIMLGLCADCGYDLEGKPIICPNCGRDASQDEPIWRKTRRQLEAKLLADAAGETLTAAPPANVIVQPVLRIDEGPIELEPLAPSPGTPGEGRGEGDSE